MHGTSFAASLTDADAPEHRTQQYFETIGNRGMYKDGWWLAMKTERIPWVVTPDALDAVRARASGTPTPTRPSCTTCPTTSRQAKDLAAEHPDKVQELKELFWEEAERYKVLPLLATLSTFFGMLPPIAEADDVRVPRRRAERDAGDDPADLQPLLRDHGRPRGARGRGRGRRSSRRPTTWAGSRST